MVLASTFVGNLRFLTKHLRLFNKLPGAQWQLAERNRVFWRFEGGTGVLRAQPQPEGKP